MSFKLQLTGKYDVGFKTFHLKSEGGHACSMFYPVDKGSAGDSEAVSQDQYGFEQIKSLQENTYGIGKNISPAKPPPKIPIIFLRPKMSVTVPVL